MKNGFIFIVVIVIAVFLFYGIRYVQNPVEQQTATIVTFEQSVSGEGYIVKKEQVYTSQNAGTFYSYVSDGERIGKNSKIASVYNGAVNSDTLTELDNVNNKIEEMKHNNESSSLFFSDSGGSESTIDIIKNQIISDVQSEAVGNMSTYKKKLIQSVTGEDNISQIELSELQAKAAQLQKAINTYATDIYSDISGVYTENVDGLEKVLTPESIMTYTVEMFDEIKPVGDFTKRTNADVGDEVCKVIDNHLWYMIMKTDKERLNGFQAGSVVSVNFPSVSNETVDAVIKYISEESDGKCVVVLSCDRYIDGILTMRNADMKIILKSYTGYKIPIYALRVNGNKKGVMINKNGFEEFRECNVEYIDSQEQFVIVTPADDATKQLQEMDNIIIGEKM